MAQTRRIFLQILLLAALTFTYLSPASAMACGANTTVTTETELNDAIACFNSSTGDAYIVIGLDIDTTAALTTINPAAARELTLNGNGHVISSVALSGNLFEIVSGTMTVTNATISNAQEAAFLAMGNARIFLVDTTLNRNRTGVFLASGSPLLNMDSSVINDSFLYGINVEAGSAEVLNSTVHDSVSSNVLINAGNLTIENSTVSDGNAAGVFVFGGSLTIEQSTVSGNRLNGVDVNGTGSVLISNTTVSDNRIGVFANDGNTSVANSTVAFNRDNGVEADGGQLNVLSSIVAHNATNGPYADCIQFSGSIQFIGDTGSSFESDGTCSSFSTDNALSSIVLPKTDILELADTGCTRLHTTLTGLGCTQVHDILPASIVVSAGDCNGAMSQPNMPAVSVDQIGESRSGSCDSGAVTATDAVPPSPGAVVIYSPAGVIANANVSFEWEAEANRVSTHYRVVVRNSANQNIHNQLYALDALDSFEEELYFLTLSLDAPSGVYKAAIRGENDTDQGPYARSTFIIPEAQPPGSLSIQEPSGSTNDHSNPFLQWTEDANNNASHYRVVIKNDANVNQINQRFPIAALNQNASGFSTTLLNLNLETGKYRIWIRGENSAGNGPFNRSVFIVPGTVLPNAVSIVSPTGNGVDANPLIEWEEAASATHYRITIRNAANANVHNQVYPVSALSQTNGGNLTVDLGINLADGDYRIWIRARNYVGWGPATRSDFFIGF